MEAFQTMSFWYLMFEMYLQKYEEYFAAEYIGADEKGDL